MKLSQQRKDRLSRAIHESILDARIALKLSPAQDAQLAQIEPAIWERILPILAPPPKEPTT